MDPQKQQGNSSYKTQNEILREMFEERQKRKKIDQKSDMNEQEEDIAKRYRLPPSNKQPQQQKIKTKNKIYLNTPIFYKKNPKPSIMIKMVSLFNENVEDNDLNTVSPNVECALITTYGYEVDTLLGILNSPAKLFLVNHSDKFEDRISEEHKGFKNFTLIEPKKKTKSYGVFHSKLWLIKFKTFLRVVICTSNQHLFDWVIWQNAFWYQDFPLKTENQLKQDDEESNLSFDYNRDFRNTLGWVLDETIGDKRMLKQKMRIDLNLYEWKDIQVVLIPSFPGRYGGSEKKKQSAEKVRDVLQKLGRKITKSTITYNCTSLGILEEDFLRELHCSFCPYEQKFDLKNFKLVYPTVQYIAEQTCGEAGVLFLKRQNYQRSSLKNQIFHRFQPNPQNPIVGCIPHLKTILVQNVQDPDTSILFMGSHNMTKAAWGKTQKSEKLSISNTELGLLFPNYSVQQYKKWIPFKFPPEPYKNDDMPFLR